MIPDSGFVFQILMEIFMAFPTVQWDDDLDMYEWMEIHF